MMPVSVRLHLHPPRRLWRKTSDRPSLLFYNFTKTSRSRPSCGALSRRMNAIFNAIVFPNFSTIIVHHHLVSQNRLFGYTPWITKIYCSYRLMPPRLSSWTEEEPRNPLWHVNWRSLQALCVVPDFLCFTLVFLGYLDFKIPFYRCRMQALYSWYHQWFFRNNAFVKRDHSPWI